MKDLRYIIMAIGAGMLVFSFVFAESPVVTHLRIIGIFFVVVPLLLGFMKSQYEKAQAEKKAFYQKNGIKAMATLIKMEKTGKTNNRRPVLLLEFKVKPQENSNPGAVEEFNFSTKKCVDISDRSKIVEGLEIEAYIHPEDYQKVLLLWEEADIKDVTFMLMTE